MGKYVQPIGNYKAKIAIVLDSPDAFEDKSGYPLTGKADNMLDTLLRFTGIPRDELYITHLVKQKPAKSFKSTYYKPIVASGKKPVYVETDELLALRQALIAELKSVNANVIVPMGNEALKALTNESPLRNYRGSILESPAGKVIPTYHPYDVLRRWNSLYGISLIDFGRIAEDKDFPELRHPVYNLITEPTFSQVEDAYTKLKNAQHLSFDIETYGSEIDCIGFAGYDDWAICVPLSYGNGRHYFNSIEERMVWEMIADLLYDNNIGKIAQNANYDIAYLDYHGFPTRNLFMDTMNAHHAVYPELPKNLGMLMSIYTRFPYHKDSMKEDRWRYNALDALGTKHVANSLDKELKEFGTHELYSTVINRAVQYYREIAKGGINVDLEQREKLNNKYTKRQNDLLVELTSQIPEEIAERVGKPIPPDLQELYKERKGITRNFYINPNSPKQLSELFYQEFKWYTYRKNGKPTTNDDALARLARRYDHPVPTIIQQLRTTTKTLSNYINVPLDPDDKLRTVYVVSGTVTGRLASRTTINDTGTNLQNIQRGEVRSMFIPDNPDWVFVEADLAGADAMVVAYESGDLVMINLFESGQDYHATNTYHIFNADVPNPDFITKYDVDQKLRKRSKPISHGANYGRSYKSIALELGIKENEAKQLLQNYLNTYVGIDPWHRRIEDKLRTDRTLITPTGRKRIFFGRLNDNKLLREAYAYVPQSTVGDIIHIGMINLFEALQQRPNFPARIALNIHDSLVMTCHKSVIEETKALMKQCMEFPINIRGRNVIIPIDYGVGNNWKEV